MRNDDQTKIENFFSWFGFIVMAGWIMTYPVADYNAYSTTYNDLWKAGFEMCKEWNSIVERNACEATIERAGEKEKQSRFSAWVSEKYETLDKWSHGNKEVVFFNYKEGSSK